MESGNTVAQVIIGNKLGVFAGHQQQVAETQRVEVAGLAHNMLNAQGAAQNGGIAGKPAIAAIIDALVR